MNGSDTLERLHEEIERALQETRAALGAMSIRGDLPPALMSICTLMDRVTFEVTNEAGPSSFILQEEEAKIVFRADTLKYIIERVDDLADEVGYDSDDERARIVQLSVNLFIVHELLHITQNFPHFASVVFVKAGLPGLGLPILDVAADTVSAWVCAHVESERTGLTSKDDILRAHSNALILSYVVGAFVFDVIGRAPKIQRALGLIISAILVAAEAEGTLTRDALNASWSPLTPLIVLDLETAQVFNAFVIDKIPGLLISKYDKSHTYILNELWNSVGKRPVQKTIELAAQLLIRHGVLTFSSEGQ